MRQRLRKVIGVLALLAVLLTAWQPAAAQGNVQSWQRVTGVPTSVSLVNVYMIDAVHGYAVGFENQRGVLYQLVNDNNQWHAWLVLGTGDPLWSVVAISDDNIWAVGDRGSIFHRTISGWTQLDPRPTGGTLRTLQMQGNGEEGWAGGFETDQNGVMLPLMLHYSGGQWVRDGSVRGQGTVESLHLAPGTGWAVGSGSFWRSTNGHWQAERAPDPCGGQIGCFISYHGVRTLGAEEAWAVGTSMATCGICVPHMHIAHRTSAGWQEVAPDVKAIQNLPANANPNSGQLLNGLTFTDPANGMIVGTWSQQGFGPFVLRYRSGVWSWEALTGIDPLQTPLSVSAPDATHAVLVGQQGLVMIYGYPTAIPPPTSRVPDPHQNDVLYFDVVGHTLRGAFRTYWERNGALPVFGYPLTEEFSELNHDLGKPFLTQYFERQRYEYHPENQGTPYDVLLGRLGDEILLQQGRDWHSFPTATPGTPHYFAQTGHAIAPQFWDYWRTHGLDLGDPGISERESLALFGYPLSEPQMETNSSGDTVLTQWFERARFEWHPGNAPQFQVLLGRLAAEEVAARGW